MRRRQKTILILLRFTYENAFEKQNSVCVAVKIKHHIAIAISEPNVSSVTAHQLP